jgi:transcriptional regulator with XRE-family HTH domain
MKAGTWFTDKLNEFESDLEFRTEEVIIDFTEKVAAAMQERGMSRVELAQRLGVSKALVTKLLNGNPNLTIRTMVSLAAALKCELLVDFDPVRNPPEME